MNVQKLEATLSKVAGFEVELTVRGLKDFTISGEGRQDFSKVLTFLKACPAYQIVNVVERYDEECDFSLLFFTIA